MTIECADGDNCVIVKHKTNNSIIFGIIENIRFCAKCVVFVALSSTLNKTTSHSTYC